MHSKLHQHLPDSLEQIQNGKTIDCIEPDYAENKCDAAQKRLEKLQGQVIVADILAPLDVSWSGNA
ncbi:MAG: hypothetical protein RLZ92_266 [Pseudomonadota bacterium]|jgi:hypothetical protein